MLEISEAGKDLEARVEGVFDGDALDAVEAEQEKDGATESDDGVSQIDVDSGGVVDGGIVADQIRKRARHNTPNGGNLLSQHFIVAF